MIASYGCYSKTKIEYNSFIDNKNDSDFYVLEIENKTNKDIFILVPESYIQAVSCKKKHLILEWFQYRIFEDFICDSSNKIFNVNFYKTPPFASQHFDIIQQNSLSEKLITKASSNKWKEDIESLVYPSIGRHPNIIFMKHGSGYKFRYRYEQSLPKGKYEISSEFPNFIKEHQNFKSLISELKRIKNIGTYFFYDNLDKNVSVVFNVN